MLVKAEYCGGKIISVSCSCSLAVDAMFLYDDSCFVVVAVVVVVW